MAEKTLQQLEDENKRLREAVDELAILNAISLDIAMPGTVNEINQRIVSRVVKQTRASQGAVFLLGRQENAPMHTMVRTKDSGVQEGEIHMEVVLTGWMIKNQKPLFISREKDPENLLRSVSSAIKSTLSVPLRAQGKFIGAITLFNKIDSDGFAPGDLRFLSIVATQSAQIIENARLQEEEKLFKVMREDMDEARRIQETLLPRRFPHYPPYDIFARNVPAKEVGGDCFEAARIDDQRFLISLGDVAGKGAGAALLMAQAQAVIRSHLGALRDRPGQLASIVNDISDMIAGWSESGKYITLFIGVIDTATHTLRYANAGHNSPYLVSPTGEITELSVGGYPMGLVPGATYEDASVEISPGSALVVFTDGVTELFNEQGVDFGEERLIEFLRTKLGATAQELTTSLFAHLDSFRGQAEPSDDITALVVRRGA